MKWLHVLMAVLLWWSMQASGRARFSQARSNQSSRQAVVTCELVGRDCQNQETARRREGAQGRLACLQVRSNSEAKQADSRMRRKVKQTGCAANRGEAGKARQGESRRIKASKAKLGSSKQSRVGQ